MIEVTHPTSRSQWTINYTQSDVDTIRNQIEQNEGAKRHWLLLALIVSVVALVGAVILLSTSYALYARSESDKKALADENAALKSSVESFQQQLKAATAAQERETQTRTEAQSRLDSLLPAVIKSNASDGETAAFARMVSQLPYGRVEVDTKPPDKLFRNWKAQTGSVTEVYTLVGGFVDGKWFIHSNLVARR
jgi:cell division protein FtsB